MKQKEEYNLFRNQHKIRQKNKKKTFGQNRMGELYGIIALPDIETT